MFLDSVCGNEKSSHMIYNGTLLVYSPMWYSWYGGQDDNSVGEPSGSLPPAPSYSQLEVPPPYEAVSRGQSDDLKPPPYTEYAASSIEEARALSIPEGYDACSLSDAPPPYTPSPSADAEQQDNLAQPNAQETGSTTTIGSPCQV
ncbi:uncharacterized protein si:dkey-118j18.2 isoform X2 [Hemiscyllium ocellatum]|uniref:uncharacterized protein si:dkey-118j18.2 isoform X2 n=1 Tax=Hemiscyllium ocellatum TaxID=170820 RepID=UPI0029663EA0|nr:uncharacterized protein si:dkey-118j18.2 isoform X2 [Hemiscyllium ocellatum]